MIRPQTPWCGKDWNPVAEPEKHRNVTDKNAQAWKQGCMLFFPRSTTHMWWWPQIFCYSLFLNKLTKTVLSKAARHAHSMSTLFCPLHEVCCLIYQTVLVLNSLIMEMFVPWCLRFPFSYASQTDPIYCCATDSRPNRKWCKLAAVFIILMISNINAFIFIVSAFC